MKLFNSVSRRIRSPGQKRPAVHLNFELCEERFLLTNYLVNSAADSITGTGNNGTLRYVLNQLPITGSTATNTIDFQIGSVGTPATITLTSDLPSIGRPVTINGYSQGGTANAVILIQLNLNGNNGLVFDNGSGNSTVKGLSISGGGAGITINTNNVTVAGNLLESNSDGVVISGSNNTISGANTIEFNSSDGVVISGSNNTISGANTIEFNSSDGVVISGSNNTISGANTIGFNFDDGIDITGSGAFGNVVQGNFIGTDASGGAWGTSSTGC